MHVGERVITNDKCYYPNEKGTVLFTSETGVCGIIQLDNGMKLLTMDYTVESLHETLN